MEHSDIIRGFIPALKELYDKHGNKILEKDVQEAFLKWFDSKEHTKYSAKKENIKRYDIVIYCKNEPYIFYELKTYLKPNKPIVASDIRSDLEKLHERFPQHKGVKSYSILITTEERINHVKESQENDFILKFHKRKRIAIGRNKDKFVQCSVRHDLENFCILTWKAL